ncbi:MAG: hypothetical protein HKN59_09485 [Gammaproteobacteria bacterium]|nr:hypothetical protein [Gammaproteobacteria bacterium]
MNSAARMANEYTLRGLLVMITLAVTACDGAPPESAATHELAAYDWLLGNWRAANGEQFVHESWKVSTSHSFAGQGSTETRGTGERKGFEELELVSRDGEVLFIATVAHNPAPVPFELASDDPHRLVFENKEHDFPKKIVYRRVDENRMRVEVSDGGSNGFALDFVRMTGGSQDAAKDD